MTCRSAPGRLLVAASSSGAGKTAVACGLMRAFMRRGYRVRACKCGPDYIDPMFHREVVGVPSRNVDLYLLGPDLVRRLVAGDAGDAITVVEGAMGYYDGIAMSDEASSWDVARTTGTPCVLVVDGRGRACSVAAEIGGFMRFRDPSLIGGVILNRVSAELHRRLKDVIERECGIPVFGHLPHLGDCGFASRHLGLVSAPEIEDVRDRIERIAEVMAQTIDLGGLLALAQTAPGMAPVPEKAVEPTAPSPVIAVARDDAFCFYYDDALDLLERLGARLHEFSPLSGDAIPPDACGLYLGGGYPELHAHELSANASMRSSMHAAIDAGMPTIAECGGFMYLHDWLEDEAGTPWPMVGAVGGRAFRTPNLARFGYAALESRADNLIADAGDVMRVHEFHYWDSDHPGDAFRAIKPGSGRTWDCAHATASLYAGFPHLCLHAHPKAAKRFVNACARYGASSHPRPPKRGKDD